MTTGQPRCAKCFQLLLPDARFCAKCGAPVEEEKQPRTEPSPVRPAGTECPSCQFQNPPSATFCERCGTQLRAPATAPGGGPRSYRPPEPADPWASGPGYEAPARADQACPRCGEFRNPGDSACANCGMPFEDSANYRGVPRAVAVQGDPAGFWVRFIAAILDGIIIFGIGAVLWPLLFGEAFWVTETIEFSDGSTGEYTTTRGWHPLMVLLYNITFLAVLGTTPAKRLFNIYVMDATGRRPLSVFRATIREFGKYISLIILLIGFIMAAFRSDKRALHDLIAGTFPTIRR